MAKAGRLFIQLDVNWYDEWGHELSGDAALLWVVATCACKRMQKDGRLTIGQLRRVAPECLLEDPDRLTSVVAELCDHPDAPVEKDGQNAISFRAWAEWNDLAAEIEAMSAGGKFGNHVKWHVKKHKPSSECEFCLASPPDSGAISGPDSGPESKRREDVDVDVDTDADLKPRRRKPETVIPDDFGITDAMHDWTVKNDYDYLNLKTETAKFINHAKSNDRRSRDWVHAWRNWIIGATERRPKPERTVAERTMRQAPSKGYCPTCHEFHPDDEACGKIREVIKVDL